MRSARLGSYCSLSLFAKMRICRTGVLAVQTMQQSLHVRLMMADFVIAMCHCNVHDARVDPSCGNWAAGVDKMYSSLGMQSPFLGLAGVGAVNPHTFRRNMGDAYKRNWAGLHDSPRTAPSARAKSCA